MAYVARPSDFHGAAPYQDATSVPAASPLPTPRRRYWMRILDRMLDARQHDAEQEVAQYLARRKKRPPRGRPFFLPCRLSFATNAD